MQTNSPARAAVLEGGLRETCGRARNRLGHDRPRFTPAARLLQRRRGWSPVRPTISSQGTRGAPHLHLRHVQHLLCPHGRGYRRLVEGLGAAGLDKVAQIARRPAATDRTMAARRQPMAEAIPFAQTNSCRSSRARSNRGCGISRVRIEARSLPRSVGCRTISSASGSVATGVTRLRTAPWAMDPCTVSWRHAMRYCHFCTVPLRRTRKPAMEH